MSDVTTELAMEANHKAMEIARLKAENAKLHELSEQLRTQLADVTESMGRVEERCAKLRELVRDMAECMDNSQPRCKKCKFRELNCQWFEFDARMRELGIEVDE